MTCREFADFIADYLSGELSADVHRRFEHHVAICPNCERYLTGYRESIALGKRAFDNEDVSLPADVPEDLVRAILALRK